MWMVTCAHCNEKPVSTDPRLCASHFEQFVLDTVKEVIDRWKLLQPDTKVIVAVSGGKDSLTTLFTLKKLGYSVTGLFVNEGIGSYRHDSREDLITFCTDNDIDFKEISFKEEFGFTLDEAVATREYHPCTICGTLRRYLLNKYAREHDVIATGHNLDDESQTIMMNLLRANTALFSRSGPKTNPSRWFAQKIKPLYLLTEEQILTYTHIKGIRTRRSGCPYSKVSYRAALRQELNEYAVNHREMKRNIIESYAKLLSHMNDTDQEASSDGISACQSCGQASNERICKACKIQEDIKAKLKRA